jgi:hypothetical protein
MHRRNGGRLATGQRCRCRRSFSVRVLYLAHRNAERGSDSLSLHLGVTCGLCSVQYSRAGVPVAALAEVASFVRAEIVVAGGEAGEAGDVGFKLLMAVVLSRVSRN